MLFKVCVQEKIWKNGLLQTKIYIPYGTYKINLRIEGMTQDGESIYRVIPLELGKIN